jgi:protein-tyrosine-phosphatase
VKKVLFVCSGNTCRSPMAKELFTRFLSCREGGSLAYEYQASSAGIWAADGLPASPEALEVMREEYAIDLSGHRSRRLNQELVGIVLSGIIHHSGFLLLRSGLLQDQVQFLEIMGQVYSQGG